MSDKPKIKNVVFLEGLDDEERAEALRQFFERNPIEHVDYGPPFKPPWQEFPKYVWPSMGWNMGPGETYMVKFQSWYRAASAAERDAFKSENPEPESFRGFYRMLDGS